MLVVVMVTFVITWLPTLLMDVLQYSHAGKSLFVTDNKLVD